MLHRKKPPEKPLGEPDMSVTAPVSHAEMWPCAASALAGLPHHSASAPCRLLLSENEVGATTTGREKSRPSSLEPVLVGFEDGEHRCPVRRASRHFAAPPVLTWATRPKQRGAQLSPRGPATETGLACSTGEAGRSGSTAPIDCASREAQSRAASPAPRPRAGFWAAPAHWPEHTQACCARSASEGVHRQQWVGPASAPCS